MRSYIRGWSRVAPLELEGKGDKYFEVLIPCEEIVERILDDNCNEIENRDQVLQVRKKPVQFLVVDIFNLLEEQLGDAEDLETAFPRGEKTRVFFNERP